MKAVLNPIHSFQTRFNLDAPSLSLLDQTARLLSSVERSLFADIMAGRSPSELKSPYLKQFDITARHYNACRVQVEGKIRSLKELQKSQIEHLQLLLKNLEKKKKSPQRILNKVPNGKGYSMRLLLPARNRGKHIWHLWRKIAKEYQVVHAAHLRSVKNRSSDPPTPVFVINTKVSGEIPLHEPLAALLG